MSSNICPPYSLHQTRLLWLLRTTLARHSRVFKILPQPVTQVPIPKGGTFKVHRKETNSLHNACLRTVGFNSQLRGANQTQSYSSSETLRLYFCPRRFLRFEYLIGPSWIDYIKHIKFLSEIVLLLRFDSEASSLTFLNLFLITNI